MDKEKLEQEELDQKEKDQEEINNQKSGAISEEEGVLEKEEVKEDGQEKEEEKSPEEKLKEELAESKDKFLRLYSEFENYRRRTSKERLDLIQTATEAGSKPSPRPSGLMRGVSKRLWTLLISSYVI